MLSECQIRDILLSVKLPGMPNGQNFHEFSKTYFIEFYEPYRVDFWRLRVLRVSRNLDIFTKLSQSQAKEGSICLFIFFLEMTCASWNLNISSLLLT